MADKPSKSDEIESQARRARGLRILLFLCLLQSAALIVLAWQYAKPRNQADLSSPRARTATPAVAPEPVFHGRSGPWGDLEFARINIEPPDEFVPIDDRLFEPTKWYFANYNRARLEEFFKGCGLSAAEQGLLPDASSWIETNNAVIVTPGTNLIFELNPAARARIYSTLATDPHNDFQFWPYTFRAGGLDDWFASAKLSPATIALVKKLVYQRGESLCFSDVPEVFPLIPDVAERKRLVKTLSRNASLLMKLRLSPTSDVDSLTAYWTGRGRKKDIRPLLDSLTDVPGSISLDIVHLLPPFARKRLNTYPDLPSGDQPAPDCFWTALNFFNDPPDERYHDDAVWRRELNEDYAIVAQPTYGDLVFLLRPDDSPLHCAVYIADDVVFTKNGGNFRQPWILMKMEDLLARYPDSFGVRTVIYHFKNQAVPAEGQKSS